MRHPNFERPLSPEDDLDDGGFAQDAWAEFVAEFEDDEMVNEFVAYAENINLFQIVRNGTASAINEVFEYARQAVAAFEFKNLYGKEAKYDCFDFEANIVEAKKRFYSYAKYHENGEDNKKAA